MTPAIALTACALLITGLLTVERKGSARVSGALWLPTCWMLIAGSRSLGSWVGVWRGEGSVFNPVEGNIWDRAFLSGMIVAALSVCAKRHLAWPRVLRENVWLFVLFGYVGISVLWTDFPLVSLKRAIRSAGPLFMAAVVLTEERPIEAVVSILRRCAYVLIPMSVVLIKYFPQVGRSYGRWTGGLMWTGVTVHKNVLGQLCTVSAVFLVWSLLRRRAGTTEVRDRWRAWSDGAVLAAAVYLLVGPGEGAYSATSITIFVLGVVAYVTLRQAPGLARLAAARAKLLVGGLVLAYVGLGDVVKAAVAQILGRREDLTGRASVIWPEVLKAAARHPLLGTGHGGVWNLGGELSMVTEVNEAHNGYLDVLLQLGVVGVVLLGAFLLSICSKVRAEASRDVEWATFALTLLMMTLVYNLSESAFFDFYLPSVVVLVAMISAAGMHRTKAPRVRARSGSPRTGRGQSYSTNNAVQPHRECRTPSNRATVGERRSAPLRRVWLGEMAVRLAPRADVMECRSQEPPNEAMCRAGVRTPQEAPLIGPGSREPSDAGCGRDDQSDRALLRV